VTTKLGDRERRLATIMVADIVGYSRLMDADEEGTYTALRAARAEVIDPKIEEQGGRIVKHLGDGFLAEFPTVMAAIQFAMSFQEEMGRRAQGVPKDRQIKLRIGVNLGDVIVDEDGDIFGDGVNVAARLEALAIPGGICISSPVYETVNKQLDVGFDDLIRQIYAAKSTRFQKMIHDGELKLRPGVKRILEAARELEIPLREFLASRHQPTELQVVEQVNAHRDERALVNRHPPTLDRRKWNDVRDGITPENRNPAFVQPRNTFGVKSGHADIHRVPGSMFIASRVPADRHEKDIPLAHFDILFGHGGVELIGIDDLSGLEPRQTERSRHVEQDAA